MKSFTDEKDNNPLVGPRYRSLCRLILICMNASLSAFWVGYSLAYVGALHTSEFNPTIMIQYHLNLGDEGDSIKYTQAIVQGLIPIGAMFGALLSSPLIKNASRK